MIKKHDEVHMDLIGVVVEKIDCRGEKLTFVKGKTSKGNAYFCFNIPESSLTKLEEK